METRWERERSQSQGLLVVMALMSGDIKTRIRGFRSFAGDFETGVRIYSRQMGADKGDLFGGSGGGACCTRSFQ